MTGPDVHTLAGAYAADALSEHERAQFEAHLAGCPTCRQEVCELRETAARLAAAEAVPPPARLLGNVMAEIARTRQLPPRTPDEPVVEPVIGPARRAQRWLIAAAVVLAIALAGAVTVAARGYQQLDAARETNDRITVVLAAPDARTATATAGGAHATVLFSRQRGQAVFLPSGMPALPGDRTYQLWLLGDGDPRPSALVPPDGAPVLIGGASSEVRALGVTVEPAGGSARPSAPPIMTIDLA
jgi:anti-sigma-K factor RskA